MLNIRKAMAEIKKEGTLINYLMGAMLTIILGLVSAIYSQNNAISSKLDARLTKVEEKIGLAEVSVAQNTRDIANIIGGVYTLHAAKHEQSPELPKPKD